jgi:hypothetical protein
VEAGRRRTSTLSIDADVAVEHAAVVVVLELHHLVADPERALAADDQLDAVGAGGVELGLERER